jgi:hypothetical protein
MWKRWARSRAATGAASFLISAYLRVINWTSRGYFAGKANLDDAVAAGKGVIVVFWHGRMMLAAIACRAVQERMFMLASVHRDGEIVANAVKPFGVEFIRGSAANPNKPKANKGGAAATAKMIAALRQGYVVGVTPDGPRGPLEKVQTGPVKLAQLSGAPIVPVGLSSSRGRRLGSWDRFLFSFPFSRCHYVFGPAIWIASDGCEKSGGNSIEKARMDVETALRSVTREADQLAGRCDDEQQEYGQP